MHVHGHDSAAGLGSGCCPRSADEAVATPRRATCSRRRPRGEVLVLRLGKQHDLDAAEHEPDHVGDDRVREERHAGTGGTTGSRRHDRDSRHARAPPARRGRPARRRSDRHGGNHRRGGTTGGTAGRGGTTRRGGRGGTRAAATGTAREPRQATGGSSGRADGPCDIYAAASTPCAAAYSMVRALSKTTRARCTRSGAGARR